MLNLLTLIEGVRKAESTAKAQEYVLKELAAVGAISEEELELPSFYDWWSGGDDMLAYSTNHSEDPDKVLESALRCLYKDMNRYKGEFRPPRAEDLRKLLLRSFQEYHQGFSPGGFHYEDDDEVEHREHCAQQVVWSKKVIDRIGSYSFPSFTFVPRTLMVSIELEVDET